MPVFVSNKTASLWKRANAGQICRLLVVIVKCRRYVDLSSKTTKIPQSFFEKTYSHKMLNVLGMISTRHTSNAIHSSAIVLAAFQQNDAQWIIYDDGRVIFWGGTSYEGLEKESVSLVNSRMKCKRIVERFWWDDSSRTFARRFQMLTWASLMLVEYKNGMFLKISQWIASVTRFVIILTKNLLKVKDQTNVFLVFLEAFLKLLTWPRGLPDSVTAELFSLVCGLSDR